MLSHIDTLSILTARLKDVGAALGIPITAQLVESDPTKNGVRADAIVDIEVADERERFLVEAKTAADRYVVVGQMKQVADQFLLPGLLVAPYVTMAMAKRCRALQIAFLDAVGNAHLKIGRTLVYIVGNKPAGLRTIRDEADQLLEWKAPAANPAGRATPTALRVIFALLCRPQLMNAPYREIRDAAGVALGAIGSVFFDLEGRHLTVGKQPNRQIVNTRRLVDEWTTTYALNLRRKLSPQRFRAASHDWWKSEPLEQGAYWGGEVAADELTHLLKPAAQTIYVTRSKRSALIATLAVRHKLQADPRGNIEVLDTFWGFDVDLRATKRIVPPLLVYADLVATADPRNLEAAQQVRERYIDNASHIG